MSIRIGKIDLIGVQNLHTEEARTLVEQRVPEQQGSAFMDLGREPVTIVLDGVLLGEDVLATLEKLRQAQAKAEPLSFAADIVVGTDLTEVVIEDFRVRQLAGYANRYQFSMRLREHLEPPEPINAATAPVDAAVEADAAAWGKGSVAAAVVLQDPASLADALAANPELLQHLDMDDLGASVAQKMDVLSASQVGSVMQSLSSADPGKAASFFDAIGKAGKLGAMLTKFAKEGANFLEYVKSIDPSTLSSLMKAFAGGLEFINQLKKVGEAAGKLAVDIGTIEFPSDLAHLLKRDLP